MSTSEHLICVASPFAMVRAQGRTQQCSSAPFDVEGSSTMILERLLALRVSSTGVLRPHSLPSGEEAVAFFTRKAASDHRRDRGSLF